MKGGRVNNRKKKKRKAEDKSQKRKGWKRKELYTIGKGSRKRTDTKDKR